MWLCWVEAFTSHNFWTLGASVQVQLQHPASTWHAMPASTAIRIFSSGHVLLCPVGDTFKPSINLRRHMITSLKFFCEKNCIQGAALPFSPCIFMSYTPQVNLFNPHMSLLAFIRAADAYRPYRLYILPILTKCYQMAALLTRIVLCLDPIAVLAGKVKHIVSWVLQGFCYIQFILTST